MLHCGLVVCGVRTCIVSHLIFPCATGKLWQQENVNGEKKLVQCQFLSSHLTIPMHASRSALLTYFIRAVVRIRANKRETNLKRLSFRFSTMKCFCRQFQVYCKCIVVWLRFIACNGYVRLSSFATLSIHRKKWPRWASYAWARLELNIHQ